MPSLNHCLSINIKKTKYIVFICNSKRRDFEYHLGLNGDNVTRVFNCKYLGVCFNDDFSLVDDIDRCYKSFLGQFNSMFYNFNFLSRDQLIFLFSSYCMSFYGMELWFDGLAKLNVFRSLSIVYHKALKQVVGLSPYHNNHDAASLSKLLLLKHLVASRSVSFLFQLSFNKSVCMIDLKNYFRFDSTMYKCINLYFLRNYNLDSIFNNNLCAIKSRIWYVQRNEHSSGYVPHLR